MNPLLRNKLKKLVEEYLVDYCEIERSFTPKTIRGKREALKRFLSFLKSSPLSIESVRGYTKHLHCKKWKPSSVKADLKVIKTFVNYLHDREHLSENFADRIVLPKIRRVDLRFVPAEIAEKVITSGCTPGRHDNKLTRKSKQEHKEALQFILRTGLRISELIRLKVEDINLEEETFKVNSKGGNIDVLPVPKDQLETLRRRCGGSGRVFKVTSKTLNKMVQNGAKKEGVKTKLTVHSLRHVFCTSLLKNEVPLQVVSRLMRHSSVKITDEVYSHYLIEDLSLALNSRHPLIMEGMEVEEVFEMVKKAVEATGVMKDKRFTIEISKNNEILKIRVCA